MDITCTNATSGTELELYFEGYILLHPFDPPELSSTPKTRKKTTVLPYHFKLVAPHYHSVDTGAFCYKGIRMHLEHGKDSEFTLKLNIKKFSNDKWSYSLQKPLRTVNQLFYFDRTTKSWVDAITTTEEIEEAYTKYAKKKTAEYGELAYQLKSVLNFSTKETRMYLKSHPWDEVRELLTWTIALNQNPPTLEEAKMYLKTSTSPLIIEKLFNIPCSNFKGATSAVKFYIKKLEHDV